MSVRGNRIRFRYRGKHRVLVRTTLVDTELAEAVRALLRYEGGARLLRFDRDGTPTNLTGPLLNAYIAEHLAPEFTAKDFRTWSGTLTAAVTLAEHGPPASVADERRVLADVMRRVGEELGNTPAVARSSYVSPAVIEQWRDGRTIERFRQRSLRVVSGRDTDLPRRGSGAPQPAPLVADPPRAGRLSRRVQREKPIVRHFAPTGSCQRWGQPSPTRRYPRWGPAKRCGGGP